MIKSSKFWVLMAVVAIIIATVLMANSLPVGAQDANNENKTESEPWPEPPRDRSEVVPFSHPLDNTVNPDSPYYDPSERYGVEGTRFGLPWNRSTDFPIPPGEIEKTTRTTQRYWGTYILNYDEVRGVYAYMKFFKWLSLPEDPSIALYAPTVICSNWCPLEVMSRYWYDGEQEKTRRRISRL